MKSGQGHLALWQDDAQRALALATEAIELAGAIRAPDFGADAWCTRGDAELALGRPEAAAVAFERAESLATAIGHGNRHNALAGRVRVALARGDTAKAMDHVETLLVRRAGGESWNGADARLVLWTCYRFLAHTGDPRAAELLASAYAELQTRAATIGDSMLRASFLNSVPYHRAIAEVWATAMAAPP